MSWIFIFALTILMCLSGCSGRDNDIDDSPATTGRDIPLVWKLGEAAPLEDIMLTTSDGIRIAASYRPAAGDVDKNPVFICVPMANRTRSDYDELTSRLSEVGIASLAIDLRGHGGSTMDGRIRFSRFTQKEWNDCVRDIYAAIGWTQTQNDIDSNYVGILGASIGANLAIKAGLRPEITLIVALSPGEDYRGVNIIEAVQKLKNKPVFVLTTDEDEYSLSAANKMALVMDEMVVLRIVEGSKIHGTDMFRIPFFKEDLIRWIKDTLNEMIRADLTEKDLAQRSGKPYDVPGTAFQ